MEGTQKSFVTSGWGDKSPIGSMRKRLSKRRKKVNGMADLLCGEWQKKFADIHELLEHYTHRHGKSEDEYVILTLSEYARLVIRES
jgi:hypothetical protein